VIVYARADEPMARVPEVTREKIFLARCIHCCPSSFHNQPCFLAKNIVRVCVCVCVCGGVEIAYDYHYYKIMLRVDNFFIQTPKR
jgi:hypothetical protein